MPQTIQICVRDDKEELFVLGTVRVEHPNDWDWQAEWDEFLRAIKTGIRPLCDAESALHSMELTDAVYRSARAGQTVSIQRGTVFA